MSYFPTYSYSSSSGWTSDVQAGPSNSNVADEWPHWDSSSFFPADSFDISPNTYFNIPISRYSTLADALGPVDLNPQEDEAQPPRPAVQLAPQQVQYQLAHPILPQQAGPVPLQPIQPIFTQPVQSVNPQPIAPTHLGVQDQNVAPPPTTTTKRRAYVLSKPPARKRRGPGVKFCRVDGCEKWTTKTGKELARHRASHFKGSMGTACPSCRQVYARSDICGKHLKGCDPQMWVSLKNSKGTQDAWGERVGQDLINRRLVDGEYDPQPQKRF